MATIRTIGDWKITLLKDEEFIPQPGNSEIPKQRIHHYEFEYVPFGIKIPRTITFIQFHNEGQVTDFLINHVQVMKRDMIDPFPDLRRQDNGD